jgi:O-antigen ligase
MPLRDKIFYILILLFIGTLFFAAIPALSLIINVALSITAFTYNTWQEKLSLLKSRQYLWWMILFMIMNMVSVLVSKNTDMAFQNLNSRLPLFYFPCSIGLITIPKALREKILFGISISITVICLFCFGWSLYRCFLFHDTAYLYNDSLTEITGQQSIYISLLVTIAIYIFGLFLFYRPLLPGKKFLVLASGIFLLFFSFLLASRNLMLLLYSTTLIFCFYFVLRQKKYLEGLTLLMGLFLLVFIIFKTSPKTLNRYKELSFTSFNYQSEGQESHYNMEVTAGQWNGANFRLAAWRCGWELFLQHPFTGIGIGDKKDKLMEIYQQKKFEFAIRTKKNLHNNYLDLLVNMGIIGLIVFLVAWIFLPFAVAWRNSDWLTLMILFSITISMITENYLDRVLGGMIVGFFIPFLLSSMSQRTNTI